MTQHDLSEIDLRDGHQRLRLRRGNSQKPTVALAVPVPATPLTAASQVTVPPKPESNALPPSKTLLEIKSPTPGTFYSSAKPGEPPFVKVGSKVIAETVVCLIEAMKIFNEIQAEVAGVIVDVAVENQQPVEYGQVLFRVDPAG
ncbi:MAG: acetyl-CoA carboxylase biotin carboxyl carrier protein [Planctomycetes bacterium]|nr:acetyl-CoA carboxylase biotin carboxyl carrier protein [Planctomycetota bacterium]